MSIFIWRFFLKNEKNRNIYGGHIQYLFTNDTGYTDALNPENRSTENRKKPLPGGSSIRREEAPCLRICKRCVILLKYLLCCGFYCRVSKSFRIDLRHISSESFFRNFDRNRALIIIIDLHAQIIHCQIDLRCLSLAI